MQGCSCSGCFTIREHGASLQVITGKVTAITSVNKVWSVHASVPVHQRKLTTSWTVAAPFERRRSVSLPFTILPSVDFGALVLIPIMSGQIHTSRVTNSSDWTRCMCVLVRVNSFLFFFLKNFGELDAVRLVVRLEQVKSFQIFCFSFVYSNFRIQFNISPERTNNISRQPVIKCKSLLLYSIC